MKKIILSLVFIVFFNVFIYSALANTGDVHISYIDSTNQRLKYCNNTGGPWNCQTIDTISGAHTTTSIALDSNNKIHIAYIANSNSLRYCNNTEGSWNCTTIETTTTPYGVSLVIDSNDKVNIAWQRNKKLRYCNNTNSSWYCSDIESEGYYCSMDITNSDKFYIAHYDNTNEHLRLCDNAGGSWSCKNEDSGLNVGLWPSLTIDKDNGYHISYYDNLNVRLKYSNSGIKSIIESTYVDKTSIATDYDKKAHIFFYDGSDLRYCNNKNGWNCSDIDYNNSVGAYPSVAIDKSNKIHVSYYDGTNKDLKYCTNSQGYWSCEAIDTSGDVGKYTSIFIEGQRTRSNFNPSPTIIWNQTSETPYFNAIINISVNVTSITPLKDVNFTVLSPNGTEILNNTNGTVVDNYVWNSSNFKVDANGTWQITIIATDINGSYDISKWNFTIDLGELTVVTEEGDQDYEYSQVAGNSELFNLTLSTNGNTNNTINFTWTGDLANSSLFTVTIENITIEPNVSKDVIVNITSKQTCPEGHYFGYINATRTEDGNFSLIAVNVSISVLAGDVDILETSFLLSFQDDETKTKDFTIRNNGNYNLTNCNMSLSTSLSLTYSFNRTSFTVSNETDVSVQMTLSDASSGSDDTAIVSIECTATPLGGKDTDSVSGIIIVTAAPAPPPPAGGGGGGGIVEKPKLITVDTITIMVPIEENCAETSINLTWTGPEADVLIEISDDIKQYIETPKTGDTITIPTNKATSLTIKACMEDLGSVSGSITFSIRLPTETISVSVPLLVSKVYVPPPVAPPGIKPVGYLIILFVILAAGYLIITK